MAIETRKPCRCSTQMKNSIQGIMSRANLPMFLPAHGCLGNPETLPIQVLVAQNRAGPTEKSHYKNEKLWML